MLAWRRVTLVGPAGRLRAPAQVAAQCREGDGGAASRGSRGEGGAVPMSQDELGRGLAWAARMLHRHRAIWRRTGIVGADGRAALIANYRLRRAIMREPTGEPTPAMRLARVLA